MMASGRGACFRSAANELLACLDATTSSQLDVLRELAAAVDRRRLVIERETVSPVARPPRDRLSATAASQQPPAQAPALEDPVGFEALSDELVIRALVRAPFFCHGSLHADNHRLRARLRSDNFRNSAKPRIGAGRERRRGCGGSPGWRCDRRLVYSPAGGWWLST